VTTAPRERYPAELVTPVSELHETAGHTRLMILFRTLQLEIFNAGVTGLLMTTASQPTDVPRNHGRAARRAHSLPGPLLPCRMCTSTVVSGPLYSDMLTIARQSVWFRETQDLSGKTQDLPGNRGDNDE